MGLSPTGRKNLINLMHHSQAYLYHAGNTLGFNGRVTMRIFQALAAALLIASASSCFASSPKASFPDDTAQLVSKFSVVKKTEVPGATLKAGDYSIRVVDHLSDRVVLQIEGRDGKALTTFLGLPSASLQNGVSKGPVAWNAGPKGEDALRGFAFPGGVAVEFVYPKAEAVSIAKVNSGKVTAIDPASQGIPAGTKLSKDDMQMLNLWLLSTTTVGSANDSQPAIQAERYQQPTQSAQQIQQASTDTAPAPNPSHARVSRVRVARQPSEANQELASVKRPAPLSALPHTASSLPLIFLAGILALLLAVTLRLVLPTVHES
jgi:hypothetical protein